MNNTLIIYSTNFTVPVRKDIGCHEVANINWKSLKKQLLYLKKIQYSKASMKFV